jgi:hypothetical protein
MDKQDRGSGGNAITNTIADWTPNQKNTGIQVPVIKSPHFSAHSTIGTLSEWTGYKYGKVTFRRDPALILKRDPEVKNMGRSRGEFEHLINPSKVNVMKELLLNQKP